MYTSVYLVFVDNYVVASGLTSLSEAEQVKSAWLGVFPDCDVKICGPLVPLKGGRPLV